MYFRFYRAFLPLVAGCLLGSGQMPSLQAKEPIKVAPDFSEAQIVHHDIFYKTEPARSKLESEKCRLDIYLPAKSTDYPVIVWFHGGGLREGDKKGDADFAASLTSKGIALVSVNYRLSPDVKFPAYIKDAATAVAWSKKNLGRYGANVDRFFVGGHSAGA